MSVLASNNIDIADIYRQDSRTLHFVLQMFMNLSKTFDNNLLLSYFYSFYSLKAFPCFLYFNTGYRYSICIEYRLYLYFVCKCKFLS